MFRPSIVKLLLCSLIGIAPMVGCDAGGSGTTTAPEGHDGKSATGHTGAGPAGGPMSPEGKAEAKKAAAAK